MAGLQLRTGKASEVKSAVKIKATSAVPLLNLLTQSESGVPSWLPKVFPLKDLNLSADVKAGPDYLSLKNLRLDSQNALIIGSVQKPPGDSTHIRLLVKADPIAVGYEEIDGKSTIRLQDAESWFNKPNPLFPKPSDN